MGAGDAEEEFGRHVILDEVDGGMVTRHRILERPNKHGQAVEAVKHRRQIFGRALRLVAGDHGVHSLETEGVLTAAGSSSSRFLQWARSRRNDKPCSSRESGSGGIGGVLASPASDGTLTGDVHIVGPMGWSAGQAWGLSKAFSAAASPSPSGDDLSREQSSSVTLPRACFKSPSQAISHRLLVLESCVDDEDLQGLYEDSEIDNKRTGIDISHIKLNALIVTNVLASADLP